MTSTVDVDATILKEKFPWDDAESIKGVEVQMRTLDAFVEEQKLWDEIFCLKIDTQGNEMDVLKNAVETLERMEVVSIEFMFTSPYRNSFSFEELVAWMANAGFKCMGALDLKRRPSFKISMVDFLFVKGL